VDPLIRAYRAEHGMNVIGLIPNGIFGENNNYRDDYSTMLPALIRRFYENRNGGGDIVIWGDGKPLREFTYGKDMARAYMWCLDHYDGEQALHIGTTEEHSVGDIAYMIADYMGIDRRRVKFDTTKPAGQFRKSTDNTKFLKLSNFSYTKFEDALKATIDWFCSHYGDGQTLRI
jgi:GDP-L-fucose synthase